MTPAALSAARAAPPGSGGTADAAYSARGRDAIAASAAAGMADICAALCQDGVTEYRLFLAKGVAAFLEQRLDRHDANAGADTRAGAGRAAAPAARALSGCLRRAPHNEQLLVHLQLMACVGERLLTRVADVRNYPRALMHPLFALVENADHLAISASLQGFVLARKPGFKHARTLESYLAELCLEDESYLAAAIPLALSALAVERLPELFGFTCALWHAMAVVAAHTTDGRHYRRQHRLLAATLRAWQRQPDATPQAVRAVARGAQALTFCLALLEQASRAHPARAVRRAADIMRRKSQFALIHHEKVMLGGRRLVELLTDATRSGEALLQALAASDWIDREALDESRFFKRLLGVGGAMHGVFSPAEIDALKNYFRLAHDAGDAAPPSPDVAAFVQCLGRQARAALAGSDAGAAAGDGYRAAYLATINAESRPAGMAAAGTLIEAVFAEFDHCRPALERQPEMAPFAYSSGAFERRIEAIYYAQSRQTKSLRLALDDDALAAIHIAFAPFALVDGCWLHNIGAGRRGARAGELLFSIFADEIGNGVEDANHANIYRRLMDDFGFGLAPTDHPGFAGDPRMPAQAFKVPAFLLAMNLRHTDYLQEMLGLNLAIEMSGLDGFYEAMIANLEQRGMRADFWRVHVSADNFSTGHARQSVHLIQDHLRAIARDAGAEAAAVVWRRIWRGFLAMIYLFRIELAVLLSHKTPHPVAH